MYFIHGVIYAKVRQNRQQLIKLNFVTILGHINLDNDTQIESWTDKMYY